MQTEGTYVYTFRLSIGYSNASRIESFSVDQWVGDEAEWDALNELEREAILEAELDKWSYRFIESSYR